MKITTEQNKLLIGLGIGISSTFIAGILLLHYEYSFFGNKTNYAYQNKLSFWKEKRTIKVEPVYRWSQFVPFNPRRYYKMFKIKLYGGDIGFPQNTSIQISSSVGKILKLIGPEAIKPTLSDGTSAVDWMDNKYRDSIKTVFVTGPNAGIQATIHVIIISTKGEDVPDSDLRIIVSPPGSNPLYVEYETDVKWSSSK